MVRELLKHLLRKPATLKYPFEKKPPFKGFRGRPVWDMKLCTGSQNISQDVKLRRVDIVLRGSNEKIPMKGIENC